MGEHFSVELFHKTKCHPAPPHYRPSHFCCACLCLLCAPQVLSTLMSSAGGGHGGGGGAHNIRPDQVESEIGKFRMHRNHQNGVPTFPLQGSSSFFGGGSQHQQQQQQQLQYRGGVLGGHKRIGSGDIGGGLGGGGGSGSLLRGVGGGGCGGCGGGYRGGGGKLGSILLMSGAAGADSRGAPLSFPAVATSDVDRLRLVATDRKAKIAAAKVERVQCAFISRVCLCSRSFFFEVVKITAKRTKHLKQAKTCFFVLSPSSVVVRPRLRARLSSSTRPCSY